jgi:hypothetical protein
LKRCVALPTRLRLHRAIRDSRGSTRCARGCRSALS